MNPDKSRIVLPPDINYIGLFLSFTCSLGCEYCINKSGTLYPKRGRLSIPEWQEAVNRLPLSDTLPLTIGGGEPTEYDRFYSLCEVLPPGKCDLLTNGLFDEDMFTRVVPPDLFKRQAPYASLRVSYHHTKHDFITLLKKVTRLDRAGYDIGIWGVSHPEYEKEVDALARFAKVIYQVDFRVKEFLGIYGDKLYGTYRYPEALYQDKPRPCLCKGSELLLDASGAIFGCHRDLYANENSIGHILDTGLENRLGKWRACSNMGHCSECDIKSKFDRFQQTGHCAVEIKPLPQRCPSSLAVGRVRRPLSDAK